MSLESYNWAWEYFKLEGGIEYQARCSICDIIYPTDKTINIRNHIMIQHNSVYQSVIREIIDWEQQFCIIQNNNIQCTLCKNFFPLFINISLPMKNHLIEVHQVTKHRTKMLRIWISDYFTMNFRRQMTCKFCNYFVYKNNNLYNSIKHLNNVHKIIVPMTYIE